MGKDNIICYSFVDQLKVEGINFKGYGILPKYAMLDQNLTLEAKAIYAYFCSFSGKGNCAFPTREKILSDLKISKDSYYRHFHMLEEQGYIKVKQTVGKNSTFSRNIYTLLANPFKVQENMESADGERVRYTGIAAWGYGMIPKAVMIDPRLPLRAKGLYAYFCTFTGAGNSSFPKFDQIIHHIQVNKESYYKYLNLLQELKYLTIVQRRCNGKLGVNDYYLNSMIEADIQSESPFPENQDTETAGTIPLPEKPDTVAAEAILFPEKPDTVAVEAIPLPEKPDTVAVEAIPLPEKPDTVAVEAIPFPEKPDMVAAEAIPFPEKPDTVAAEAIPFPENQDTVAVGVSPLLEKPDTDEPDTENQDTKSNSVISNNFKRDTLSLPQSYLEREGEREGILPRDMDDLVKQEILTLRQIPLEFRHDEEKITSAIHFLTSWDELYPKPYSDQFRCHIYNLFNEALIQMCQVKNLQLKGGMVTGEKVIKRLNQVIKLNKGSIDISEFMEPAMDNYYKAASSVEIRYPLKYMQSCIWDAMLTGNIEMYASLKRNFNYDV